MPEPTIVPPTPTVRQGEPPAQQPDRPAVDSLENVQAIFDRVLPAKGVQKPPPPTPETMESTQPPQERTPRPPVDRTPPPPEPSKEPEKPKEGELPSFLQEALRTEKPATAPPAPSAAAPDEHDAEIPENLPPEQKQTRIKGLRDAYKRVKEELKAVKERPPAETPALEYVRQLEAQNGQMMEMLSRVGVEHSAEFQNTIMRPLYASWNEAARIVKEAGGDPNELRTAMSLGGRAQFEALDNLFAEFPESAKAEAHDALRNYRRFEAARAQAVANAPKTMEQIRAKQNQQQVQEMGRARNEMVTMFDNALAKLRDEAKVEVFLRTNDPETAWWNQQGDQVIQQARSLFLENTDMEKVAFACLLAPAADAYRNLFMKAQKEVAQLKQVIRDKGWTEPNLSESSGNAASRPPEQQLKQDLNRPFNEVFLEEFHRQQGRSR